MAATEQQTVETVSASEMYQAMQASKQETVVSVTLPSGFVIKMAKPSRFTMLFRMGVVPQQASAGAVEKWIEAGVLKPGQMSQREQDELVTAIKLRDKVLELSRHPKLVVGDAMAENELSTDALDDDDAAYLLNWVAAGGEAAAMVAAFPGGRKKDPLASSSRRKVRRKAKQAGGAA